MGEVYRVRDVRLGRTVAVKVLPPHLAADESYRERFHREARAASALSHPSVAHVYDVGEQGGRHFIAMECVEGENLREIVDRGPLPVGQLLDVGVQIASALDEAHSRGIIHRDIKSANVVVSARGLVKVLDFGLARHVPAGTSAADSQLSTQAQTGVGVVMGTVPYMSPEQALGRSVDARTDVYSLGVVLYELATGRLPFSGTTAPETIDRICHAEPAPIGRTRPEAPPELERIVGKCLEKDRERRYASAADLLVDLRNLKRDLETGASGPPAPGARSAPWRRVAAVVALVAPLAALLALVAVRRLRLPSSGPALQSVAVLPFKNESRDPGLDYLSDGVTESLINSLSQLPRLRVISRTSAFAFRDAQDDLRSIGKKLGVRALVLGRMVQRGAQMTISVELVDVEDDRQLWGGRFDRRREDLLAVEKEITATIARTLRVSLSGAESERLARGAARDPEAHHLYLKGRHFMVGTAREMERALDLFEQARRRDPEYALAHAGLAEAHLLQALYGRAGFAEAVRSARAALDRALAIDADLREAHVVDGMIREYYEWDWTGAEAAFRRAIAAAPGSATACLEFSEFLQAQGRVEEAQALNRRALELDPLSRIAMHHVGYTHFVAREYEQAIAAFRRTLEIHPDWVWGHVKLGRSYALNGQPAEALAEAAKAESLLEKGGETPLLRGWLAALYAVAREPGKARAALRKLEDPPEGWTKDAITLADVYLSLGDRKAALLWLERAYEQRSPLMVFLGSGAFDELKGEPRYEALLRRTRLPSRGA